jgi:hypothetical protein
MKKAFNMMNFLLAIIAKLGFPQPYINWINICISSSSFSIILSGNPFGLFSLARGLIQGDLLFAFSFFSSLVLKVDLSVAPQRRNLLQVQRYQNNRLTDLTDLTDRLLTT